MPGKLLQATTITFLLYLVAQTSSPKVIQPTVVSPSPTLPRLVLSFRP